MRRRHCYAPAACVQTACHTRTAERSPTSRRRHCVACALACADVHISSTLCRRFSCRSRRRWRDPRRSQSWRVCHQPWVRRRARSWSVHRAQTPSAAACGARDFHVARLKPRPFLDDCALKWRTCHARRRRARPLRTRCAWTTLPICRGPGSGGEARTAAGARCAARLTHARRTHPRHYSESGVLLEPWTKRTTAYFRVPRTWFPARALR